MFSFEWPSRYFFGEFRGNQLNSFLSSAAYKYTYRQKLKKKKLILSSGDPKTEISTKISNYIYFTISLISSIYISICEKKNSYVSVNEKQ